MVLEAEPTTGIQVTKSPLGPDVQCTQSLWHKFVQSHCHMPTHCQVNWQRELSDIVCWLEGGLPCESFLFFVPRVINIVAVTVHFLIASKLFLSQPEIFTFCASSPSCHYRKGERKAEEQENGHSLEGLSGGTEPFLNRNRSLCSRPPVLPMPPWSLGHSDPSVH